MSLLAVAAVAAVLSATPAAGVVEPLLAASSNVQLLAHIPGTAAGMNFKDHYAT